MKFFFEDENQNTFRFEMGTTQLKIQKNDGENEEESFESVQAMSNFFRAEIEALTKSGFTQRLLPEDRISPPPSALDYFENTFLDELKNTYDLQPCDSNGILSSLEENLGTQLTPNFQKFIAFRDSHSFDTFKFGEISFSKQECEINSFEDAILRDQSDSSSIEMVKHLVGASEIGKQGGNTYLAVPHEYAPSRTEVWLFSDENFAPTHAVAADIPSFFYANHLLASKSKGGNLKKIKKQFKPIKDRVRSEKLSEKLKTQSDYISDSKDNLPYTFNRSYWISHLFQADEDTSLEDIAFTFHIEVHTPQVWENVRRFRFIRETPTTQLYWLWRLFWFNRPTELAECIELTKESPSRFVKSTIELILEFESGRKTIGKIDDIHALRDQWVELGLDPASSEQTLQAEADAADKIESDLAMAHEAIRTLTSKELFKKAWGFTSERNIMEVWLEHLRHQNEIPSENLDRLESQVG